MEPLTVLIADDHEIQRKLLTMMFEAFGCVVSAVATGDEAVRARGPFDIICLDRHMPGLDGDEAASLIAGGSFMVACTSDPAGLGSGFRAVVSKPVSCSSLANVVSRAASWRERLARWTWRKLHPVADWRAGGAEDLPVSASLSG
ncbi:MAG: hypothetical protein DI570_05830 [Phenylobacterium zucineum]|nr:MAG: hypothetical protein DI570_05830 [Phenylobacterium zucineum]